MGRAAIRGARAGAKAGVKAAKEREKAKSKAMRKENRRRRRRDTDRETQDVTLHSRGLISTPNSIDNKNMYDGGKRKYGSGALEVLRQIGGRPKNK